MKWILAFATFLALPVQAALIEYTYDATAYKFLEDSGYETSPGTVMFLVDTSSKTIERFSYNNDFSYFLSTDTVTPNITFRGPGQSNGFNVVAVFENSSAHYVVYLEYDFVDITGTALNYLDTINLAESHIDFRITGSEAYYATELHSADKRVVSVPEPATLSLLALGLAAIGIRRRYS